MIKVYKTHERMADINDLADKIIEKINSRAVFLSTNEKEIAKEVVVQLLDNEVAAFYNSK